jgi:hypothetical protein
MYSTGCWKGSGWNLSRRRIGSGWVLRLLDNRYGMVLGCGVVVLSGLYSRFWRGGAGSLGRWFLKGCGGRLWTTTIGPNVVDTSCGQ